MTDEADSGKIFFGKGERLLVGLSRLKYSISRQLAYLPPVFHQTTLREIFFMSKIQKAVSRYLSRNFSKYTIRENTRPEWMLDDTGQRLELDFFIEELNLAIEVQGKQHYQYVEYFHGSESGFADQQNRDWKKYQACLNRGITFVEIASESDIQGLEKFIPKEKPRNFSIKPPKKRNYSPYIGLSRDYAIKSIKMRLKEIERLKADRMPQESIQHTRDAIKDLMSRYIITWDDVK